MKPFPIRFDEQRLASIRVFAGREGLSDAEAVRRLIDEGLRSVSGPHPLVEAIGQLRLDLLDQADRLDALDRRLEGADMAKGADSRSIAECLAGVRTIVQKMSTAPALPASGASPRAGKEGSGEDRSEPKGLLGWGRSRR